MSKLIDIFEAKISGQPSPLTEGKDNASAVALRTKIAAGLKALGFSKKEQKETQVLFDTGPIKRMSSTTSLIKKLLINLSKI